MKTKSIMIICMVAGTVLLSCEDLLIEKPKTFVTADEALSSESGFNSFIVGMYRYLTGWNGLHGNATADLREVFAEYYVYPQGDDQALNISKNKPSADYWASRESWTTSYQIISNANLVIGKIAGLETASDDAKNKIEGEAKLLRAFAYFHLVQVFGAVPLRTTIVTSIDQTKSTRAPEEEVYELIASDLQDAEEMLGEDFVAEGRGYKWAATALLSKVYLTMAGNPLNQTDKYPLARDKALEVINSGKFSLMPDYASVFHNTSYTTESIWEVKYAGSPNGDLANYLMYFTTGNPGNVKLAPNPLFIASFDANDQRRTWGIKDSYVHPVTGSTILSYPYFNKYVDESFLQQGLLGQANNISKYNTPILRLAEMYLIAAEAENEINGPANAFQYINPIRDRSGIADLNPALSKEQFRAAVFQERRWELHLEFNGWTDLKRTNNFEIVESYRTLDIPIGAYNNTFPIPDFEINSNNIPQNPPYGG